MYTYLGSLNFDGPITCENYLCMPSMCKGNPVHSVTITIHILKKL